MQVVPGVGENGIEGDLAAYPVVSMQIERPPEGVGAEYYLWTVLPQRPYELTSKLRVILQPAVGVTEERRPP